MSSVVRRVHEAVVLKGDEEKHEQTDAWSNRDLIPLPPARRTWGAFHYFGYWTLSSLNIATWQTPNTYLSKISKDTQTIRSLTKRTAQGLSVGQAMAVIIISRAVITIFACFVAWCGLTWHIGFTIQNRFTWGMRGSYIPLLQRVLLNFIWNAVQSKQTTGLKNCCQTDFA